MASKLKLAGALFVQSTFNGGYPPAIEKLILEAREELDSLPQLEKKQYKLYVDANLAGIKPEFETERED